MRNYIKEYQKITTILDNVTGNKTEILKLSSKNEDDDYVFTNVDNVDYLIPKQIALQVSGKLTSLNISGKISEDAVDLPLGIINMQTLETVDSIVDAGIYMIPCEEIEQITLNITGASNSTVIAKLMF